ncbi:MAG: tetratricopeptide repeat protein [Candidatus Hydrogenedentes bacterium]|nr:tetratricopeptide repeat protein [Candidatus Hydrogenedentota bacterium]
MMWLFCLLMIISGNGEEIYQKTFRDANEAYYTGNFSQAIENYLKLIQGGLEEDAIFYNLGNSFYHLGKKGFAIACYHYALDLNPSLHIARENLEKVLNEVQRKLALPEEPSWWKYLFVFHYGISKLWTWIIAAFFWLIGWVILGVIPWFSFRSRKYVMISCVVLISLGAVFLCSGIIKEFSPPRAVLIVDKANVHILPSENSPSRFELYEGDRFLIEREEGEWVLVKSVGNEKGWIKEKEIVIWNRLPEYFSKIGFNK